MPLYNPPPAEIYQPMEDTVVPLFFNSYLYLPKDPHIRNGFMEILPELFSNARPGSHLHTSTLAVAFFTLAAWTGQEQLLKASQRYFMEALPKIRVALLSNDDNEYNDILMSIMMMSTYEEFVAMKDWEAPMKAHLRGAIALINSRKTKAIEGPSSSTLHQAVQTQIIKTTRGLEMPMVPTPEVWPLAQTKSAPSPRIFLSLAASEIVTLRQLWEQMRSERPTESEVLSVLNKATQIDTSLVSWKYWVPSNWNPVAASIIPQSVRDAGLYNNLCDCYADMWIASTWNTYRDCRILVQSIMLKCLRLLPPEAQNGNRVAAVQSTIQKLADEICASVPFFLGSQMESVQMKSTLVQYPFAETRPVTSTHKQSAPLMGAWQIFPCLRNLQPSDLGLPSRQVKWLEEQMNRVLVIYFQK
ncbi:hypothetical protein N7478_001658 [Penicillium angulare]|uniref:uncharacterized protein n=1 Tax=Penicillium angulare TaxID=116970 RepID=UPI00254195C1|nr:uncharacterized protein N7478_001658 [Penicillium angulare]KAJ5288628.1 hypothetical protein N7478_001658 [Penicillium angulare]